MSLRSEFSIAISAQHKTDGRSSLYPVVFMRANGLFILFVFAYVLWYPTHIDITLVVNTKLLSKIKYGHLKVFFVKRTYRSVYFILVFKKG